MTKNEQDIIDRVRAVLSPAIIQRDIARQTGEIPGGRDPYQPKGNEPVLMQHPDGTVIPVPNYKIPAALRSGFIPITPLDYKTPQAVTPLDYDLDLSTDNPEYLNTPYNTNIYNNEFFGA